MSAIDFFIELAKKGNGVQIFPPAMAIGIHSLPYANSPGTTLRRPHPPEVHPWYRFSQKRALLIESCALHLVTKLKTAVPQSGEALARIRIPKKRWLPRIGWSPCSSVGKCEGTQSRITPILC